MPRPDVNLTRAAKLLGFTNHHVAQTALWVFVALLSALLIYFVRGTQRSFEFITAYIVEYSLSVDNLFMFMVIFRYFRVSDIAQETALNWGVIGAMAMRGIMILLGKALIDRFQFISLFFALILIYSSFKLLFNDDDDDEDLENNSIVKFSKKCLPVSNSYDGDKFFVMDESSGNYSATPLILVLAVIELSDVVFALDSVPAVLGLSNDTLVIYSSNILAVMGLRSLFFVVSDAIKDLRFLQQALAIVLGFIGMKMIAAVLFKVNVPVLVSLGIVCGTLTFGVLLSIIFPKRSEESEEEEEAHEEIDMLQQDIEAGDRKSVV